MKPSFSPDARRRGSILPLVGLASLVLLGAAALGVDYGVLLADRNHLQRACDAAALAGASYLKRIPERSSDDTVNTNQARDQARRMLGANELAPGEVTASSITFSENNTKIRVAAARSRSLFFAGALGISRGNIKASAVAVVGKSVALPVPIAITPTSKRRYQNDGGLPHTFTLVRPNDTAFRTNYSGLVPFDPFAVFDLRGNQAKSTSQMQRQLGGDDYEQPKTGDELTGLSASLGTQASAFKEGISPRLARSAAAPYFDPATGPLSPAWQTIGTRLPEVLAGGSSGNPRIVSFVVVEEKDAPVSNYNFTIQDFATAYISSVQDTAGGVSFTATFLPAGSGMGSRPVSLVE